MSHRTYDDGTLFKEWDDGTATYRHFVEGEVVEERGYTADETDDADARAVAARAAWNSQQLRQAAADAIASNRDFLALTAPTNAQTLAQVKALTRQVSALARFGLGDLGVSD